MKLVKLALTAAVVAAASSVNAMQVASYSWEDGKSVMTSHNSKGMNYENIKDASAARSGEHALLVQDLSHSRGTPNATLAWVHGLKDGDTITASFWVKDDSPKKAPSVRIWAHYTGDKVTQFKRDFFYPRDKKQPTLKHNTAYSAGNGWEKMSVTYSFNSFVISENKGLAIEVRFYDSKSAPTGEVLIDDITVATSSATATIEFAGVSEVPVPAAAWLFGSAILGLATVKRRK